MSRTKRRDIEVLWNLNSMQSEQGQQAGAIIYRAKLRYGQCGNLTCLSGGKMKQIRE